jgi:GTP-binding protein
MAGEKSFPIVFISAVAQTGLDELNDVLWKELNSESNKLQEITAEDTLVHRDKEMSQFARELMEEGEDVELQDEDEMDDDDIEILDDYEIEDIDE